MDKETIIRNIKNGVSAGILTVDDVLVVLNRLVEESIRTVIVAADGKLSFSESAPRLVSCCFAQIQELDVREIWFDKALRFKCENPETNEEYQLDTDDFLLGELRHIKESIQYKTCSGF